MALYHSCKVAEVTFEVTQLLADSFASFLLGRTLLLGQSKVVFAGFFAISTRFLRRLLHPRLYLIMKAVNDLLGLLASIVEQIQISRISNISRCTGCIYQ